MSCHGPCNQPHENTNQGTARQRKQSSTFENAPTQRWTPMHPLQRQGRFEMQDRAGAPLIRPTECTTRMLRHPPAATSDSPEAGSGGGTGNCRRLWAVEAGPLPTPAGGANGGVALGRLTVSPRQKFSLARSRRRRAAQYSSLVGPKGENTSKYSPYCTTR